MLLPDMLPRSPRISLQFLHSKSLCICHRASSIFCNLSLLAYFFLEYNLFKIYLNLPCLIILSHKLLNNNLGRKALSAARLNELIISRLVHIIWLHSSFSWSWWCCGHNLNYKTRFINLRLEYACRLKINPAIKQYKTNKKINIKK